MAKRKRVALFINSLCGGGAERVVSRISKELDKEYVLYIFLIEGKRFSMSVLARSLIWDAAASGI